MFRQGVTVAGVRSGDMEARCERFDSSNSEMKNIRRRSKRMKNKASKILRIIMLIYVPFATGTLIGWTIMRDPFEDVIRLAICLVYLWVGAYMWFAYYKEKFDE